MPRGASSKSAVASLAGDVGDRSSSKTLGTSCGGGDGRGVASLSVSASLLEMLDWKMGLLRTSGEVSSRRGDKDGKEVRLWSSAGVIGVVGTEPLREAVDRWLRGGLRRTWLDFRLRFELELFIDTVRLSGGGSWGSIATRGCLCCYHVRAIENLLSGA